MKTFSKKPGQEKLEIRSCGVCGSSSFQFHWDCGDFQFQKCKGCGVLYQNPQPDPQELLSRYDEEYSEYEIENAQNYLNLMLLGMEDAEFSHWEESYKSKGIFLDIGCATGALLEHLKKRGWEVQGLEPCEPAAKYGREKRQVNILTGVLEESTFAPESFGLIHFSHVIEHLTDPAQFIKNVSRILKPGGRVLITTPNIRSFQAWLFQSRWRSAIADHMYLFSPRQLSSLLLEQGIVPKKWKTWGGLAVGAGPLWLKKILDPLSKRIGLGDVVMVMGEKQ